MSVSWKKGNEEPIPHLEKLMKEIVDDKQNYYMSVNEKRLNGKIQTITIYAEIIEDEGE